MMSLIKVIKLQIKPFIIINKTYTCISKLLMKLQLTNGQLIKLIILISVLLRMLEECAV